MPINKTSLTILSLVLFGLTLKGNPTTNPKKADVIIYGGTSAGVTAAIQAARLGRTVVLIEPSRRLGGLTTGGLGQTDIGNKQVIGGISREFYQNIKKHYEEPENWVWQERSEYRDGGQTRTGPGDDAMWTFEPSAALKVFHKMIEGTAAEIVYGQRLQRVGGVLMEEGSIVSIAMETGETYRGRVYIDATYEGDLMAAAGIAYTVGRESNAQYGESLNGIQANKHGKTLLGGMSSNDVHHNFITGVNPYVVMGDPSSGLLPFISGGGAGIDGEGDKGVQAYCFRMTLTDHPENRIPFAKPENYNEQNYELLFRNYEAAKGPIEEMYWYGDQLVPWINSAMPNRKTDTNNQKGFSTDFIGQNYDYPEATYEEREEIINRHRDYQQGLMWTLAYHPRTPEKVKAATSKWGTCKDEYEREDGWQQQLYIREARRMTSDFVMTQKHCEGIDVVEDPIGMAAYGMDSHHIKRYVTQEGFVKNEGNIEAHVKGPYPIGYGAIVPKKEECRNLIVPICLSASHIAFGSIRMEPVFMILGQSAAVAASLTIEADTDVQAVHYPKLRAALLLNQQILE